MSKNPNLDKVKRLSKDANNLRTIESRFKERVASSNVDKYKLCFGHPDRSLNAFEVSVALVSYTGAYGSSSVSSFSPVIENSFVRDAFHAWLNKNREMVLNGIAHELELEAESLINAAKEEIEFQADELKAIEASFAKPAG